MLKKELQDKISDTLKKMGCTNIEFSNGEEDKAVVRFNCEILISFKTDLEDWSYSGIQLNNSGSQKYKIEFRKKQPTPSPSS